MSPEEFFADDPAVRDNFYHEEILIYMAGPAAVALLTGKTPPIRMEDLDSLLLGHDLIGAVSRAAAGLGTGDDRKIRAYLLRCRREAKSRLHQVWRLVESVAKVLLDRVEVGEDDLKEILGQGKTQ